jgi:hypothetical protein
MVGTKAMVLPLAAVFFDQPVIAAKGCITSMVIYSGYSFVASSG